MQKKKPALPLGAAFSHARTVEGKTGGGHKKQRQVAQRYLRENGHQTMAKASPTTLGAYQAALAATSAPGHMSDDDKYAMAAYQKLFDRNHQAMAQARAEGLSRTLAYYERQQR